MLLYQLHCPAHIVKLIKKNNLFVTVLLLWFSLSVYIHTQIQHRYAPNNDNINNDRYVRLKILQYVCRLYEF